MLLRAAIRASLWTFFAFVIVAVGTALAIDLGLVDRLFGTDTRTTFRASIDFLQTQIGVNRDNIELALKIIGLAATITFGALGLLRAYVLGYASLPFRLEQFAHKVRTVHLDARYALLAPYLPRNLRGDQTPTEEGLGQRTLRLLGLDQHARAVRRVMRTTERLDGDLGVLDAALRLRKTERITAHLLEGVRHANDAKQPPEGSAAQHDSDRAALAEYEKAVALDPTDLDALEFVARQTRAVNASMVAARLERMASVAHDQNRPVRRARALRFQAEFIGDNDARKTALREMRAKLDEALAALEAQGATQGPVEPSSDFERALVNEDLARLHMRRGTFTLVAPYLNDADAIYGRLPPPEGPAGKRRVVVLRRDLARAQLGGDDPDDLPTGSPTPVN